MREAVDHAVDVLSRASPDLRMDPAAGERRPEPTAQALSEVLRPPLLSVVEALASGKVRSVDLVAAAMARAERWPGILTDTDRSAAPAYDAATTADEDATGSGALAGLPVTVKDNVDVAGLASGQGGVLGRREADADSTVAASLRDQGAVLLGHTAMHELAWGLTTPGCPNPWGDGLTPGGSSGGAAASVAAGIADVAIGTDTGGSIRVPAALCGVAGLRPTHGTPSLQGIAPLSPSLDTVGALAPTAADCVFVHELLAGPGAAAPDGPGGLVVGVLGGWRGRVSPGVEAAVDAASGALRARGVEVVDVEVPDARLAPSLAYVIMLIESSRIWLSEAKRHGDRVGGYVQAQLREGGRIAADDGLLGLARSLAAGLRAQVLEAMQSAGVSALVSPVTAAVGVGADGRTVSLHGREVPVVDVLSRYTGLASVTGLPALSVPAGLDAGRPVGVQLIGRPYDERLLAWLAGPIEDGPGADVSAARARL